MTVFSLSTDERAGDKVTHLMKSGPAIRTDKITEYEKFTSKIPKSFRGVSVSYDLWWDNGGVPDKKTKREFITGFAYTDMLNKCLYFKPTNSVLGFHLLESVANNPLESVDEDIVENITKDIKDKYSLASKEGSDWPARVIFLPGTNILESMVDMKAVKRLINEEGAKVKAHPLTSKYHLLMLKHEFGEENLINKQESGMDYLFNAEVIFCCSNSEMGLSALLLGKRICLVDNPNTKLHGNYKCIYDAILRTGNPLVALKKILSSDYSGIVSIDDPDAFPKIYNFLNSFNTYRKLP